MLRWLNFCGLTVNVQIYFGASVRAQSVFHKNTFLEFIWHRVDSWSQGQQLSPPACPSSDLPPPGQQCNDGQAASFFPLSMVGRQECNLMGRDAERANIVQMEFLSDITGQNTRAISSINVTSNLILMVQLS